ncbi:uncharacterized protein PRCAT00002066001 [Priceomyces carsonii]|uniref:uncharacterized protein n=1 Tax=Priceomyces carsonii TaxID=28549 RepID=UPI002EDB03B9|nr:unnamed protein product [Priceomyces carsonii]
MIPEVIDDKHVDTFLLLADTIVHDTSIGNIEDLVDPDFPKDKLEEYVSTFTKPSEIPGFKESIKDCLNGGPVKASKLFVVLMSVLDSRILAPSLTGSLTLIRDMPIERREALLKSWRDSPILAKRRLFKSLYSLTVAIFVRSASDLHNKAIGFPAREMRQELYEGQKIDDFRYTFMKKPKAEGHTLHLPNIDVLIVGSGSGAGVVAHTLAESGYTTLVLEKGKYFANSEFAFDDNEGSKALYEKNGTLPSDDQELFVLAGSTMGGGSTVNWSACLKTPFKVRKEWYDEFGVEWAAGEQYEECMEYVWKQMGASSEHINHSFTNQVILDGAHKLGYHVKTVAQNTGNHPNHDCGLCHLGCKFGIKQGSLACWFRDAASKGTEFMDQVKVVKIIQKQGKATGVLCRDITTGVKFTITGPKKIVVCGGSLNTPIVLQNSGFKNKHIGSNLKLHPACVVFGDFGKEQRQKPFNSPILTTVSCQVADLDGKEHGARIESILHTPFLESAFLPWNGSDKLRRDLLKYNSLSAILIIDRDTSSGKVSADAKRPDSLIIDYNVNKFDRRAILKAIVIGSDILYIEGAKEIIHPQSGVPSFKSNKPKHERSINDKDYQQWRKIIENVYPWGQSCPYGSAHQMSSCRMSGKGPSHGAIDTRGRLYDCKNVYVADASAMPTASGVNPMITTMALARLIALGIVRDLQPSAKI